MSEPLDLFTEINHICAGRDPRPVLEALADQMAQVLASCSPDHANARAAAAELFMRILVHVDAVHEEFGIPFRVDERENPQ